MKRFLCVLPLVGLLSTLAVASDFRCHSEQFTKAKSKLDALVLNSAQKQAIATYEADFRRHWATTHQEKGCSHHEAHVAEFIAAASGVLTPDQFKTFRGRERNETEQLQNDVWSTGVYIDNLIKIARAA